MDRGLSRLLIETGGRIGHVVTGDDDLALQQYRLAVAFVIERGTGRHPSAALGIECLCWIAVHQAILQRRRRAEQVFHLARILHPRQFHDNAPLSLLLDHRLGHAERVHAIAQRGDVLFESQLACRALLLGGHEHAHEVIAVLVTRADPQVAKFGAQQLFGAIARLGILESHVDAVTGLPDGDVADPFVAQFRAHIAGMALLRLGYRRLHIDIDQDVDATAQVEAEVHRPPADAAQPAGHIGR